MYGRLYVEHVQERRDLIDSIDGALGLDPDKPGVKLPFGLTSILSPRPTVAPVPSILPKPSTTKPAALTSTPVTTATSITPTPVSISTPATSSTPTATPTSSDTQQPEQQKQLSTSSDSSTVVLPPTTTASPPASSDNVAASTGAKSFMDNKGLAVFVFVAGGLVALVLILVIATWALRRRRRSREIEDAISFEPDAMSAGKYEHVPEVSSIRSGGVGASSNGHMTSNQAYRPPMGGWQGEQQRAAQYPFSHGSGSSFSHDGYGQSLPNPHDYAGEAYGGIAPGYGSRPYS